VNSLAELADRQWRDYRRRQPGACFADPQFDLSLAAAYELQDGVAKLRVASGDRLIGYKVGCTGPGTTQQFGTQGPIRGRLFVRLAALIALGDATGEQSPPGYSYGRGLDGSLSSGAKCNPDAYCFARTGNPANGGERPFWFQQAPNDRSDIAPLINPRVASQGEMGPC
jgi:hypothetical protein